jgi:hypothetical protein
MKGTWETTGDGDAAKAVTAVVGLGMVAALVYEAAKGAARTLGEVTVIAATAAVALVVGVGATMLVMRLRRRRDARPAAPAVQLWHANPRAVPVRPRRELPAPVVNVNIDAGLLAGLMNGAQQPAPVIVTPAREEIQP